MSSREKVSLHMKSQVVTSVQNHVVSHYFGSLVFSESELATRINDEDFRTYKAWQQGGNQISKATADAIAEALKAWALKNGATSYSHWFQPMTGLTAEKHDSFISFDKQGSLIEKLSGSSLIMSEPDASSFPSGGLRTTFEARGYTAWVPSSPAFIREVDGGRTLCIPSIFVSYHGEALDKKLPLLRSDKALEESVKRLFAHFGKTPQKVYSTCGAEQEFFLIDEGYYKLRQDLQLTGRTLVGAAPTKGQQLEDQYFGSIKTRVLNYMTDVEKEAYSLGIPLATRHNEVAPHQYEFAPIFEATSLAADHNQLLMDILQKVAQKHGLVCLLHEKPFQGVNGSGKHVNWSLTDEDGTNYLNPGETPEENWLFITLLTAIISGVHTHGALLRASIASAGNEHRLGAHEAPPSIMSIFLGKQLTEVVESIVSGKSVMNKGKGKLSTGLDHLPILAQDYTDRNRTSPFAFTGNKFEFRACGSAANISTSVTVVNTIVAQACDLITAQLNEKGRDGLAGIIKELLTKHQAILFEGNNYSAEWVKEAAKRGLPNIPSTAEALKAFIYPTSIELFTSTQVFNQVELESRYAIWIELYNHLLEIEAFTLENLVETQILPQGYRFQAEISQQIGLLNKIEKDESIPMPIHALDDRKNVFARISEDIYNIRKNLLRLHDMLKIIQKLEDGDKADYLYNDVKPYMDHIRKHVDHLELIMPDEMWFLPKYREMLFNL